jgi:aryl-alcohol dehydrogenase-like predicted oxidoreductase
MLAIMERRRMGRAGIDAPVIGVGTYKVFNVKGDAGQARCEAVVDAALDAGANLFDSSPMYGEAEKVLADSLGERRRDAIVATKVWARDRAIGEEQIEHALDWYGGTVDIYQVHNLLSLDDHLPVLHRFKDEGAVRGVGVTHYLPGSLDALLPLMRDGKVDVIQVPYHPLEQTVTREVLPEAHRLDVGVLIMTPLGGGRLVSNDGPTVDELAPLADFGVHTWPQALMKWVISDERVHCALTATSSADHMRENAAVGQPPWFTGTERLYVRRLAQKYYG